MNASQTTVSPGRGTFCSDACRFLYANSPERFWERFDTTGNCWLWTGAINKQTGYGTVRIGRKCVSTHRRSWELTNGPVPDGLLVCHDCDRFYPAEDRTYRRCGKPAHLFLGTAKENAVDSARKGRSYFQTHPELSYHPSSLVVTAETARDIQDRHNAGAVSQASLAREFGVSPELIRRILRGAHWTARP
jgi:hypothetical protein